MGPPLCCLSARGESDISSEPTEVLPPEERPGAEPGRARPGNGRLGAGPKRLGDESLVSDPPELAEGTELMGEYEGSGFKEPRYLVKRSDDQLIQLDLLIYSIAKNVDGKRSLEEIAEQVTEEYGRTVSAGNVRTLIARNLIRDGLITLPDGSTPRLKKADPLLQLKMRTTLLPEGAVNLVAGFLRPLFWPPLIVAVLLGLVMLDIWYFGTHGVGQSLRETLYQPLVMMLSILWHEFGHATAAKYGGATPGKIGFGVYVMWPAFYTDVTEVYGLDKRGRVRTDLGGVYFNSIFALAIGGTYFLTRFEPLLVLIMIQHLLIVYQFMPFLRMDGYFVISDLTGVPDLFARLKPTVQSMLPGKQPPKQVRELKTWARAVVAVWVLTVIPVLLFLFGMMVISAPRLLSTSWDSLWVQWEKIAEALGEGAIAGVAVGAIQSAMLILPIAGMSITTANVVKRIGSGLRKLHESRPGWAVAARIAIAVCVLFAGFVLWPNGEYRPVQRQESWTFEEGVRAASKVPTGRPSLTQEAARELGGAPTVATDVPGRCRAALSGRIPYRLKPAS
jgi:putative peptide zinc metalloprotease protein